MRDCTILGATEVEEWPHLKDELARLGADDGAVVLHCHEERLQGFLVIAGAVWIGIRRRPSWLLRKVLPIIDCRWEDYRPRARITAAMWQAANG